MLAADYDVAIIGAGLLGSFTARNLARYNWRIAVFEKNCDVCTEVSKANTAIIYPGYDPLPGTLKARLNQAANRNFFTMCRQLGVRYRQPGSMMVSFGEQSDRVILKKYEQGLQNGVKELKLLTGAEVIKMEPNIRPNVTSALYAKETSTVNPWELCIAAAENSVANGVHIYLNAEVTGIDKIPGGYSVKAGNRAYTARAIVNCGGLYCDDINNLINKPSFRLRITTADYMLLDEQVGGFVRHIIMHEPEKKGRGATIVPTVDGNLLLGPSKIKTNKKTSFETTHEGCEFVAETSKFVFPSIPLKSVIRIFSTLRPSISLVDSDGNDTGQRLHDLPIFEAENPGFINLAGIKTPGLTCCDEIGRHVLQMLLDRLGNPGENISFCPTREKEIRFSEMSFEEQSELAGENPAFGKILCRCRKITEGEVRQSIRKDLGATTLDGVKRRTGALMGRCQGAFCTQRIIEILAEELGKPITEICKDEPGSELFMG